LIGVGVSLVADGTLGGDREGETLRMETKLSQGRAKLRKLRTNLVELQTSQVISERRKKLRVKIPALEAQLAEGNQLLERLVQDADAAQAEVVKIQNDWLAYRQSRRDRVRSQVAGEFLGDLQLVSGRRYRGVIIKSVDATGMKISHHGGMAFIKTHLIPFELRQELDLSLEESEAAFKKERAAELERRKKIKQQLALNKVQSANGVLKKEKDKENGRRAELERGKAEIASLIRKMNRAQSAASRARSNDAFSSMRSVPGSLQTWSERARAMDRAASKYRIKIRKLVSKLQRIAPNYRGSNLD